MPLVVLVHFAVKLGPETVLVAVASRVPADIAGWDAIGPVLDDGVKSAVAAYQHDGEIVVQAEGLE